MPITALPTPPSRSDSANFASRADSFLAALPTFATEANATATEVNNNAISAAASALSASNSATLTTVAGAGITGNSTTSLSIGTGSKSLTIETGKAFVAGLSVRVGDASAPNTNYMDGTVTSYNSGTGALVVNVTTAIGSGTFTSWSVRIVSAPGLSTGATITTATTLTAGDANLRAVNMSTASQSVTLPNATQLTAGRQYTFDNIGGREFGVRNSTGQLIARVGANLTVSVYLMDNSTAAGTWAVEGTDALFPLTICDNTFSSTYAGVDEAQCRLTDTLSLHVLLNSGGTRFIVAVDHSTYPATVGTPVSTGNGFPILDFRRISNTKAFLVSNPNVYNITVSGTTITLSSSVSFDAWPSSFTGAPTVCNLTDNLIVGIRSSSGVIVAQAADLSGAAPSVGTAVNIVASGGQAVHGVYRITDTTALAIYTDDSGTAGAPFSLRAVVLTVTGTTISIGTTAGVNDVLADGTEQLSSCQLTTSSYVVSYRQTSTNRPRVVHIGVSGTTVTFGTPLEVEAAIVTAFNWGYLTANRFQPNLFALTSTTALMTYFSASDSTSRHVVITNSGGTLTAGNILFSAWTSSSSGNFPQRSDRFLTLSNAQTSSERINAFSISGTNISRVDFEISPVASISSATERFGLSGNYFGICAAGATNITGAYWNFYKFNDANGLQYLGRFLPSNSDFATIPIELASNRVSFIGIKEYERSVSSTNLVSLVILEFPL